MFVSYQNYLVGSFQGSIYYVLVFFHIHHDLCSNPCHALSFKRKHKHTLSSKGWYPLSWQTKSSNIILPLMRTNQKHYFFVGSSVNVSQKALYLCHFNPWVGIVRLKVMLHVFLYPDLNKISLKHGHFNTTNMKPDNDVSNSLCSFHGLSCEIKLVLSLFRINLSLSLHGLLVWGVYDKKPFSLIVFDPHMPSWLPTWSFQLWRNLGYMNV